jgi:hypothetical protein
MTLKHIFFIIVIQFFTLSIAYSNEKKPFFDGTTLTIPTVSTPGQSGAYHDVKFKPVTNDTWKLLDYKSRVPMPGISKVELFLTNEHPIQGFLIISGGAGTCTTIRQIRHELIGNTIKVFMDSNQKFKSGFCTKDYRFFKEIIPLPLYNLKSGEYKYTVNGGFEGVFRLSRDNSLEE